MCSLKYNLYVMISGFSKLNTKEKIDIIIKQADLSSKALDTLLSHHHNKLQETYNQFSENTISNFFLPFNIAPNFLINGKEYFVPMAIEESSVVAAASKAASFWYKHGGFEAKIIDTVKVGQLFFSTKESLEFINSHIEEITSRLISATDELTISMKKRGGGIKDIVLQKIEKTPDIYCFYVSFETKDSMGANFINSCLETMGEALVQYFDGCNKNAEIIMAILSNYTPQCIVECNVSCNINELKYWSGNLTPQEFANKFKQAVDIAKYNISRAVTHNKGIMNGIDAVVVATGNDYRAIEANIHAYAAKDGTYSSLSEVNTENDIFSYNLKVPLTIGTVGGLTKSHPMAALSMEILGNPNAIELMGVIASTGLANNFSAVASLITTGIQKGHMKMHLSNILLTLNASDMEKFKTIDYFSNKTVSYSAVQAFLNEHRKNKNLK